MLVLDGERVVVAESQGTRLGTGLHADGPLDPEARERTLAAIAEFVALARSHGAEIAAIATSAMRRATDGADFAARVKALAGCDLRIISGEQEATYSFLGATRARTADERVAVLDVGGGSTEIAVDLPGVARATGRVAIARSFEIGAVRIAERFPALLGDTALDAPARRALIATVRAAAAAVLAPMAEITGVSRLIAVGGTAFTAAAMVAQAPLRDGITISGPQRAELLDTLLGLELEARRALPYIRPQRADILPAGLIIVDEVCRLLGVDTVEVSESDLLAGYLHETARNSRS